jgi:cytochrome P450
MLLADAAAIKVSQKHFWKDITIYMYSEQEVTSSRARFPKPLEQYAVIALFGHNIVVSEGEEWKKYRKISAPAFSDVSLPYRSKS